MVTTRELAQQRLTVAQAADQIGVTRGTVYRYVRDGRIRASREAGTLLLHGLDVWIASGYRHFGRSGPPVWTDEEWAEYMAEDAVEIPPPELRHLLTA